MNCRVEVRSRAASFGWVHDPFDTLDDAQRHYRALVEQRNRDHVQLVDVAGGQQTVIKEWRREP